MILILLISFLVPGTEGVGVEDFEAFFKSFYNPSVHYDGKGRVLMEGSPLTAGHIEPDWENAVLGKERVKRVVKTTCTVPICVEREVWTSLASDGSDAVRELAERELVMSFTERNGVSDWTAVIRYRIIDPMTHRYGRFTGLVIDVDPNSFRPIALLQYQNGLVIMKEEDLGIFRWTRMDRMLIDPGINDAMWKMAAYHLNQTRDLAVDRASSGKTSRFFLKLREYEGYDASQAPSRYNTVMTAKSVPVICLPEVWSAIIRFKYYPVTVKK